MADHTKLIALLIFSLLLIAVFIGVGLNADNYAYFLTRRIPKVLAIILAASAIAVSSLVFQTLTHNRILTPSIMGFDALYLLIQSSLIISFGSLSVWLINPYLNFLVSSGLMIIFSFILFSLYFFSKQSHAIHSRSLLMLLLVGLILGELFANASSFLLMIMDPNDFESHQKMLFANFNQINSQLVYISIVPLIIAILLLWCEARRLDVLLLNQQQALSLGINIKSLYYRCLIAIAILVAIATALTGPILFFGLLVVNLARYAMRHYQHHYLFAAATLIAISLLLIAQWLVEHAFAFATSISVIIQLSGGCYLLYLLGYHQQEKTL